MLVRGAVLPNGIVLPLLEAPSCLVLPSVCGDAICSSHHDGWWFC